MIRFGDNRILNISFDFSEIKHNGEEFRTFDFDNLPGKKEEYDLLYDAVRWYKKNEAHYNVPHGKCRDLFDRMDDYIRNKRTATEYKDFLNEIADSFLNNPYLYDNNMYDNKKNPRITADCIACYLVSYRGTMIPIGIVKIGFGDEITNSVVSSFMSVKSTEFQIILDNEIRDCDKFICEKKVFGKRVFGHILRAVMDWLIVCASVFFVFERLIRGVDWSILSSLITEGGSVFHLAGVVTEAAYGVSRNSTLCLLLLILSIIWAFIFIRHIKTVFVETRQAIDYICTYVCLKRCRRLKACLWNLSEQKGTRTNGFDEGGSGIELSTITPSKSNEIVFCSRFLNQIGLRLRPLNTNAKVCSIFWLLVLMLFMMATLQVNKIPDTPETFERYNELVQKISLSADQMTLYADRKYVVTQPAIVYPTAYGGQYAVCELNQGQPFRFVSEETDENKSRKVKFFTEHGFISGWLLDATITEYSPVRDDTLVKKHPNGVEASSTSYGIPTNVCDGTDMSIWVEGADGGGVGEYVDFIYEQAFPVRALVFGNGNCYSQKRYEECGRASEYTVEFYNNDTFVDKIKIALEDVRKTQNIFINKGIFANKVRFVIDGCIAGSKNENACITQLAVYAEKEVEQ